MKSDQTVIAAVERDVVDGFQPYLSKVEFTRLELFPGSPHAITEDDTSVVVWQCSGRNDKRIHNVEAAGQQVTVEGVTIVHHPDGTTASDWDYHRFIDWNSVAAQIGTSRGRAGIATPFQGRRPDPGPTPGGLPVRG